MVCWLNLALSLSISVFLSFLPSVLNELERDIPLLPPSGEAKNTRLEMRRPD